MMKSILKTMGAAALAVLAFSACEKDDASGLTSYEKQIKSATEKYVSDVIYTIYGDLAAAGKTLNDDIVALKENTSYTDADIRKVCDDFLAARALWEASEAFLFGAATDFSIDPHIDSWPLDVQALANNLSNSRVIAALEENGVDAISQLGASALGFHGLEFVLFRDGAPRSAADLRGQDAYLASEAGVTGVTGREELIFAAAVSDDLMTSLYQLNVSWNADAPKEQQEAVEEAELNCTVNGLGKSYGEDILGAAQAGSTYATWQLVAKTILVGGCANITDEVASSKMGQAHSGEDTSYIESPYSKNSFTDFKNNILSVQYSLYGAYGATAPASQSLMTFLKEHHAAEAKAIEDTLAEALAKLDVCIRSGHFVDDYKAAYVGEAIDAIDALTAALEAAAEKITD